MAINFTIKRQKNGDIHIWHYNTGAHKKIMKAILSLLPDGQVICKYGFALSNTCVLRNREDAEKALYTYLKYYTPNEVTYNHKSTLKLNFKEA